MNSLFAGPRKLLDHIIDNDAAEMSMIQILAGRTGISTLWNHPPMSPRTVLGSYVDSFAQPALRDYHCSQKYLPEDLPVIV